MCVSSIPHAIHSIACQGFDGRNRRVPHLLSDAQGVSGRTLLSYSISPSGIAQSVEVIRSDNPAFGSAAIQFLRDWHFDVPADWGTAGGPERRLRVQVLFVIDGRQPPQPWYPVMRCTNNRALLLAPRTEAIAAVSAPFQTRQNRPVSRPARSGLCEIAAYSRDGRKA